MNASKKILGLPALIRAVKKLKKNGGKLVFTNGCFDILHVGHTRYLKKARALAGKKGALLVAVNSDLSVKRLKGMGRPVNSEKDRVEILSEFPFVDFVTIFKKDTPYSTIKAIVPDILVKGGDWAVAKIVGGDIVKAHRGKVLNIPLVKGRSTTGVILKAGRK